MNSCASTPPHIEHQITTLIADHKADQAVGVLESQRQAYGSKNELLYLLDKAFVLHLAGRFEDSITVFEQAKLKFDQLYTQSISKEMATWAVNDYLDDYRGEDFERVLINIFQALNFAAMNNFSEALVEARDVDTKLNVINSQYKPGEKNAYKEDAFARFLMGILYEVNGSAENYNDAFISYRKAWGIYTNDYASHYGLNAPETLKQNLLAAAKWMGRSEFNEFRRQIPEDSFWTLEEKKKKGQLYLIQYNGLAPFKVETSVPLVLPGGYLTKIAFPKYLSRYYETSHSNFIAKLSIGIAVVQPTEVVQDIGAIAVKNLEDRKVRVMAKTALRPAAKYLLERTEERNLREHYGSNTALVFRLLGSLFNFYSEQADLRSWQMLPSEIRLSQLVLDPGTWDVSVDNFNNNQVLLQHIDLGKIQIKAGEVRFLIVRTVK